MQMPADAFLAVQGTAKNIIEKQTADGPKTYVILETLNNFGEREAFFVKVGEGVNVSDFEVGQKYFIPVLTFVGDNRRLFLRTNPEHPPQRLDG
jgi:hypothetical protein